MNPIFFANASEFRKWLEENHRTEKELVVGYYKVNTGKPSMSWSESVDEALCFGWIDGIRRSVDEESYCIRFTPRNPKSNWSAVNISKVKELIHFGKMTPAGLQVFEQRREEMSATYSYENPPEKLSGEFEKKFRENKLAWEFFMKQSPSYKKVRMYWVMEGKQEATRWARLEKLIQASESGQKLF